MSIRETLREIQGKLKAPKGQTNSFGGYKYRSCEDILEAVKPLLGKATLKISDEMVQLGERYYVKATVTLTLDDETEVATAYAREALSKKGMDSSQITGAASSYARKYALNGLFLIDDTKDADSMDNTSRAVVKKVSKAQITKLKAEMKKADIDEPTFCKVYNIDKISDLPAIKYEEAITRLKKKSEEK